MTRTTGGDIIPAQQITGWVDGCYVADMTTFASHPVDELTVDFGGVVGDRHAGRTRRSSQWEPWHKRGTEIRHDRQITIVSPDELAEVAAAMGIAAIRPEWIVANLAFTGIPQLSTLPAGTRLVIADGPVLFVEGPNDPCRAAGASIGRHYPGRDGHGPALSQARQAQARIACFGRQRRTDQARRRGDRARPGPAALWRDAGDGRMTTWSATQYLKFEDERSRPARDLLARVPLTAAWSIVDIGCGPGNSTELLVEGYPQAEIIGLDTSADMLVAARKRLPGVSFVEADIAGWSPAAPVDLLFSNAVFHWVPGHLDVLARLMTALRPGGVLAVQMPDNLGEPSDVLMRKIAAEGPWRQRFVAPIERETIQPPAAYHDRLSASGTALIDVWHTIYNHVLDSPAAIVEWMKGTGLRPYLARLSGEESADFLRRYGAGMADAYPSLADGRVLYRFPRLFVVAVKA